MATTAYHLEPGNDLAGLTSAPQDIPEPGPHQVVLRMRAAALNRRDLMLMEQTYPVPATPGVVPLCDGVGEVVAIGSAVTRATVGDRVTGTYFLGWIDGPQRLAQVREQHGANHNGMLANYACVDEQAVVHPPAHLTDIEAATLTCAGVTAWSALSKPVPAGSGDTVLTVGSGTVVLFGVQFAHALGARVISITSSPAKAERLRALGAAEVIDRSATPEWEHAVVDLTDGDGVTRVLDTVGMPTLPKSLAASAFNAEITLIGAYPAAPPAESDVTGLPNASQRSWPGRASQGLRMPRGPHSGQPASRSTPNYDGRNPFADKYLSIRRIAVGSRTDFDAMNRTLADRQLRPVIDRVFPFDQAVDAYQHFRNGNPFGKVVITM